jgi:hypothetical protein
VAISKVPKLCVQTKRERDGEREKETERKLLKKLEKMNFRQNKKIK